MYFIPHCFICRPSDSTVSEDDGIEPRTVATSAFALTTRFDLDEICGLRLAFSSKTVSFRRL